MGTNLTAFAAFLWRASKEKWKVERWEPELLSSLENQHLLRKN
jgi:hypothetical protein